MSKINLDSITSKTIADIAVRAGNDQIRVSHVCTLAFAGQTLIAPTDSILQGALDILVTRKAAYNKSIANDKGAPKYQAINALSTMISRWLKGQSRFEGKRVSIKTTGATPNIALITPKQPDVKPQTEAQKKATAAKLSGTKNCPDALKALIDAYGYATVKAELLKLA